MKKSYLAVVGLLLCAVFAGCAMFQESFDKATTLAAHVHTLKTKGCAALPEGVKKVLVVAIKQKIENYPDNGICDPNWVRDVLIKKIELLESDNVQDRSLSMGYPADSRYGHLGDRGTVELLLSDAVSANYSTGRVRDRFGDSAEAVSLVYTPVVLSDSASGSGTRLHLFRSMAGNQQAPS